MPLIPNSNRSDAAEFLDDESRALVQRLFGDLSKGSVAKQLAVGCLTGWCSGYLFVKVGKVASLAVGGSLLVLQVAHHQGWISVHWGNVDNSVKRAKKKFSKSEFSAQELLQKLEVFVRQNMFLSSGFAGGFLIGLAS